MAIKAWLVRSRSRVPPRSYDRLTLAAPFAAEVELDRMPELLGEIEWLRAVLRVWLTRRGNRPGPAVPAVTIQARRARSGE